MREIRLALVGFGNVGQAFARLIMEKQQELEADYDFTPVVTGIITGRRDGEALQVGQPRSEIRVRFSETWSPPCQKSRSSKSASKA